MRKVIAELTDQELQAVKEETRRLSRLARVSGVYDVDRLEDIKEVVREEAL